MRHGLNISVPIVKIEQQEARNRLGIDPIARVLLIFGKIQRYKGVESGQVSRKDVWLKLSDG